MVEYLLRNALLPKLQSAYRRGHSTETALLKVFSDILGAMDRSNCVPLYLPYISATFDTVDRDIIRSFGVSVGVRLQP